MSPLLTLGVVLIIVGVALVVAAYSVAGLPVIVGVATAGIGFVFALVAVVTKS